MQLFCPSRLEAARVGTGEVSRAVVASTLTTICVFVPIVFVEGVAGQLFGDQALTVTYSLLISLLVALTVIPMLASRTFGSGERVGGPEASSGGLLLWLGTGLARAIKMVMRLLARALGTLTALPLRLFQAAFGVFAASYGRLLGWALPRPFLTVLVAVLLLAASLNLYPRLGQELVPELVQGEFYIDTELPPGSAWARGANYVAPWP